MVFTPEVIAQCQGIMRAVAFGFRYPGFEQDDLISCAWLRVCGRINDFDQRRGSFQKFVSAHARYAMLDYLRMLRPAPRSGKGYRLVELNPNLPARIETTASLDVFLLLRKARLSRQERTALALRYSEERKLKEVGRLMGFGESRACQLVGSALLKLRAAS